MIKTIIISVFLMGIVRGDPEPKQYIVQYVKANKPLTQKLVMLSNPSVIGQNVENERSSKQKLIGIVLQPAAFNNPSASKPHESDENPTAIPRFTEGLVNAISGGVTVLSSLRPILGLFDSSTENHRPESQYPIQTPYLISPLPAIALPGYGGGHHHFSSFGETRNIKNDDDDDAHVSHSDDSEVHETILTNDQKQQTSSVQLNKSSNAGVTQILLVPIATVKPNVKDETTTTTYSSIPESFSENNRRSSEISEPSHSGNVKKSTGKRGTQSTF